MNGYPLEFSVFYYLLMILNKNCNNNPENLMILLDCYNDRYNASFVIDDSNASKYINGLRKIPSPPYDRLVKYKTEELTNIIQKLNISNITTVAQTFCNLLDDPIISIDPVLKTGLQSKISNTDDPFEKIAYIYHHALKYGNNRFKLKKCDKEELKNVWDNNYKKAESDNYMLATEEASDASYKIRKDAYQDIYYNILKHYSDEYTVLLLVALFSKALLNDTFNSDELIEFSKGLKENLLATCKDPEQLPLDLLQDKEFIDDMLFLLFCHDALTMTIINEEKRFYRLESYELASFPRLQRDIYDYLIKYLESISKPEGLPSEKP